MGERYGIDITIDPRNAKRGADAVERELQKLDRAAEKLSKSLGQKISFDRAAGKFVTASGRVVSNATLARNGIQGIGTAAKSASGGVDGLTRMMRGLAAAAAARGLVTLGDGMVDVGGG